MYKLILHHTYKLGGEAVDVSQNDNHGFRKSIGYVPNGRAAETGAAIFNGGDSDILVTKKRIWNNLRAIKIEAWVYVNAVGTRRLNIIEGDRAFAFFIESNGLLMGTFLGPQTTGGSPTWHGTISNAANAPDGVDHVVPTGQWVKLTYQHDGISTIKLLIDDRIVAANYSLIAGVPSVMEKGINVGHWVGDDRYTFDGYIDDIKVWKYDPEFPVKQFYCRPMSDSQMECLQKIFDQLAAYLRDPNRSGAVITMLDLIRREQMQLVRELRGKGEDAQDVLRNFSQSYNKLWCSGDIDSEEMIRLLSDFFDIIIRYLGKDGLLDFLTRLRNAWEEMQIGSWFMDGIEFAKCDPQLARYIRNLGTKAIDLEEYGIDMPGHWVDIPGDSEQPEEPEPSDDEEHPDEDQQPDNLVRVLRSVVEFIGRLLSRLFSRNR